MTNTKRIAFICTLGGLLLVVVGWLLLPNPAAVQAQDATPTPTGNNSFCVVCHNANSEQTFTLADGTELSIAIDNEMLAHSVHGANNSQGALGCVDCHSEAIFPHNAPPAATLREYRIGQANLCIDCHRDHTENLADDVHYTAIVGGNLRAALCVDCHGSHDIQPPDEPRERISETCGSCHQIIFEQYRNSVHGKALFEGDPIVPTCIDCHGVHGIGHPTTALFRNRSPELCANCHGDAKLMADYGLSTHILDTYLSDFHGKTVALFEQTDPEMASNKAVCFDCHGVHDIQAPDENGSRVIRQNLLATCQECHPTANEDFPNAWVGHFPPTLETHPLLWLVNLFYKILIPLVVGAFIFLVATDIIRRIRKLFSAD